MYLVGCSCLSFVFTDQLISNGFFVRFYCHLSWQNFCLLAWYCKRSFALPLSFFLWTCLSLLFPFVCYLSITQTLCGLLLVEESYSEKVILWIKETLSWSNLWFNMFSKLYRHKSIDVGLTDLKRCDIKVLCDTYCISMHALLKVIRWFFQCALPRPPSNSLSLSYPYPSLLPARTKTPPWPSRILLFVYFSQK